MVMMLMVMLMVMLIMLMMVKVVINFRSKDRLWLRVHRYEGMIALPLQVTHRRDRNREGKLEKWEELKLISL